MFLGKRMGISSLRTKLIAQARGLKRHWRLQVAALCYRDGPNGVEVLLITSRGTGRWVLPKGWMMRGKTAQEAAVQEAWEEAGVCQSTPSAQPIGHYDYDKWLKSGLPCPVRVSVFALKVHKRRGTFPEADERRHQWMPPSDAADKVDEPQLKALLAQFPRQLSVKAG